MIEGSLSDVSLPGLLQFLATESNKSFKVSLTSGGLTGQLLVCKGEITSAIYGLLDGNDALTELLFWPEGRFSVELLSEEAKASSKGELKIPLRQANTFADQMAFLREAAVGLNSEIVPSLSFGTQAWQEALARQPLFKEDYAVLGWITDGRTMRQAMREFNFDVVRATSGLFRLLSTGSVEVIRPTLQVEDAGGEVPIPGLASLLDNIDPELTGDDKESDNEGSDKEDTDNKDSDGKDSGGQTFDASPGEPEVETLKTGAAAADKDGKTGEAGTVKKTGKSEAAANAKSQAGPETKEETKAESRGETKSKTDGRLKGEQEVKSGAEPDSRSESKSDSGSDSQSDSGSESKVAAGAGSKSDCRAETAKDVSSVPSQEEDKQASLVDLLRTRSGAGRAEQKNEVDEDENEDNPFLTRDDGKGKKPARETAAAGSQGQPSSSAISGDSEQSQIPASRLVKDLVSDKQSDVGTATGATFNAVGGTMELSPTSQSLPPDRTPDVVTCDSLPAVGSDEFNEIIAKAQRASEQAPDPNSPPSQAVTAQIHLPTSFRTSQDKLPVVTSPLTSESIPIATAAAMARQTIDMDVPKVSAKTSQQKIVPLPAPTTPSIPVKAPIVDSASAWAAAVRGDTTPVSNSISAASKPATEESPEKRLFDMVRTDPLPIVAIDIERLFQTVFHVAPFGHVSLSNNVLDTEIKRILLDFKSGKNFITVAAEGDSAPAQVLHYCKYCLERGYIDPPDAVASLTADLLLGRVELEQYLLQRRRITGDELRDCQEVARQKGLKLTDLLVKLGFMTASDWERLCQEKERFARR